MNRRHHEIRILAAVLHTFRSDAIFPHVVPDRFVGLPINGFNDLCLAVKAYREAGHSITPEVDVPDIAPPATTAPPAHDQLVAAIEATSSVLRRSRPGSPHYEIHTAHLQRLYEQQAEAIATGLFPDRTYQPDNLNPFDVDG